jgi:hypothetical protein
MDSSESDEHLDQRDKERKWTSKNATQIIKHVRKAIRTNDFKKTKEEPVTVLEDVLDSLQRDNLSAENLSITDLPRARKLAEEIRNIADSLKHEYWELQKGHDPDQVKKKLEKKFRVKH